jgi:hypothetical protein
MSLRLPLLLVLLALTQGACTRAGPGAVAATGGPRAQGSRMDESAQLPLARSGRSVDVLQFGADPTGELDSTPAIQAALSSGAQEVVIPAGTYRIVQTLYQAPMTRVRSEGVLAPDPARWSGEYAYEIHDRSLLDYGQGEGQYNLADRTSVHGLTLRPTGPLDAKALRVKSGGFVVVSDLRAWEFRRGGVSVDAGYEVNLQRVKVIAPKSVRPGAAGFELHTSDGMISHGVSQFYPVGMRMTQEASANVVTDVHVWGMPHENGAGWEMRTGFEIHGAANTLIGCYADTPEKLDPRLPASLANGGIGFFISGWENRLVSCMTRGAKRRSQGYAVHDAAHTTLVGCNALPFENFEPDGFLALSGKARGPYTYVLGGNVSALQHTPTAVSALRTQAQGWERPPLLLGDYFIWVDNGGKLRMKRSRPTSDSDGTLVGTQE